jgi:hypothetical protein
MNLCKYKDMVGKPGTGIHSYRLFDVAIVDVIVVILFGVFVSKIFKYDLINVLVILFISGVIAHKIFCVDTTINKILFG